MPYVPVVNVAQVEMVYSQQGQVVENVFHVQAPGALNAGNLATIANEFGQWHELHLNLVQNSGISLNLIRATDLTTALGTGIEFAAGLPRSGGGGGSPSPMNVTLAVKWITGFRGRSYRGRSYHIGLREEDYVGSTMLSARLASIIEAYRQLLVMFATDMPTYSPVVVSRRNNKVPRITGVASIIVGVTAEATTDSQRRRLPGRGR